MKAPELLEQAAETYRQRQKIYGPTYKQFGLVMKAIFPEGFSPRTTEQWNRLGVITMCVTKLCRYASTMDHQDSAHDLCVYAAILEELTTEGDQEDCYDNI